MAVEVFMPRLTHDMESGRLIRWLRQEGELVRSGDVLFEVETDKAVTEVAAEASGRLVSILFEEGQDIPVGTRMATIAEEGESLPPPSAGIDGEVPPDLKPQPSPATVEVEPVGHPEAQPVPPQDRVMISPVARKIAEEYQLDISQIHGSGPRRRIVESDVRSHLSRRKETRAASPPLLDEIEYDEVSLTQLQRITGQRMELSARTIPQFTLEVDVRMKEAERAKDGLSKRWSVRLSYTALILKAIGLALQHHPRLNASFADESIRCYRPINVGVAMAVPDGLIVPVVRQANTLELLQIQEKLDHFKDLAALGSLGLNELSGGTFTFSNLGMVGVDRFTALVNPPQAAILTAGRIQEIVAWEAGSPVPQPRMALRLSLDHRVVDGATAAPFLNELKGLLENPYLML